MIDIETMFLIIAFVVLFVSVLTIAVYLLIEEEKRSKEE